MAHELKSPLSAIRLEAEEIRRMSGLDEVKEKADELLRDSDSMKSLLRVGLMFLGWKQVLIKYIRSSVCWLL